MPGRIRKYNVPEACEGTALVFGEQHRKLDIVLRCLSKFKINGYEKLDFINLRNRIMIPLLTRYFFRKETMGSIAN